MARIGIPEIDPALEAELMGEMLQVEELMRTHLDGKYPFVIETSRHLVDAGGKRLRPLVALLAARFGKGCDIDVLKSAVVVELTHLGTLYHDDVMDEAPLRRGVESANNRWTNTVAILTGDYLFAKVSALLADLGPEAVRLQAHTFERLVIGQIKETQPQTVGMTQLEHYLSVISDKTSSLIATSARYGAMISGAPEQAIEILTSYGEKMGTVFQLADDIIDIESTTAESGKTPGTDLREGVPTLVTLFILDSDNPADADLKKVLSAPIVDEEIVQQTLTTLRSHSAMVKAKAMVVALGDQARAILAPLPDGAAKLALISLCDAVITRTA
jgi:heptaprenyl diphosphate synthase